jgi:hypothetical protein
MSALFLLALAGVIFGFVRQSRIFLAARHQAAPAAPPAVVGPQPAAVVQLASGAHIVSASTDAGKLILHVATPSGGEVDVIDLSTGRLSAQVRTAP